MKHLSNKEVLSHFATLKQDNDNLKALIAARTTRNDAALRKKYPLPNEKDEDVDEDVNDDYRVEPKEVVLDPEVDRAEKVAERRGYSEDLGWTTDEPDDSISILATTLQNYGLVKGEVLQLINLAPSSAPEIYCVIEELEHRMETFNSPLDNIIQSIQETLSPQILPEFEQFGPAKHEQDVDGEEHEHEYVDDGFEGDEEEQFITEAEWGKDKEDGVGEEQEDPME